MASLFETTAEWNEHFHFVSFYLLLFSNSECATHTHTRSRYECVEYRVSNNTFYFSLIFLVTYTNPPKYSLRASFEHDWNVMYPHTVLKTFRIKRSTRSTVWQKLIKWLDAVAVVAVLCISFAWSSMPCTTRQMFSFENVEKSLAAPPSHMCQMPPSAMHLAQMARAHSICFVWDLLPAFSSGIVTKCSASHWYGAYVVFSCYTNIIHTDTQNALRSSTMNGLRTEHWRMRLEHNNNGKSYERIACRTHMSLVQASLHRWRCRPRPNVCMDTYFPFILFCRTPTYVCCDEVTYFSASFVHNLLPRSEYVWALFISWIVWSLSCCVHAWKLRLE